MERVFAGAGAGDLVFLMRQCLERGAYDHALGLWEAFGAKFAGEPAFALCAAIARFVGGEREAALEAVTKARAERPADLNVLSVLSEMRARSGDKAGACATLAELIAHYPDYPGAQTTLASLLLPGPPYREVLKAIHRALAPRTYLEIGVETGGTLALATSAEVAVGVDPADFSLEVELPANARVVRATSDAFFADHTAQDVFGSRPLELAFIDGMHLFEFALRDFINVERWCAPGGTVVDTWKAVWALALHRPDLKIRTVLTPPSGLVIVRRLDPKSSLLGERVDAILRELAPLDYPNAPGDWPREFGPVPNTPEGLREALG
jgi:hypothetical protein